MSYSGNPGPWRDDASHTKIPVMFVGDVAQAATAVRVPPDFDRFIGPIDTRSQQRQLPMRVAIILLTIVAIIVLLPLLIVASHSFFGPGPDFVSRGNHMTPHGSRPVA